MIKVKVKDIDFEIEDHYAALVLALQELTSQIKRLANK